MPVTADISTILINILFIPRFRGVPFAIASARDFRYRSSSMYDLTNQPTSQKQCLWVIYYTFWCLFSFFPIAPCSVAANNTHPFSIRDYKIAMIAS